MVSTWILLRGCYNPIGKMPKTHMVLLEKAIIYNGILMESIGISVMASFGLLLLLFFTLYYDTLKKSVTFVDI